MSGSRLTSREDEVLRLTLDGFCNDEIATRLGISRRTVEAHMRALFRKTGVSRRAQLAALYQRGGVQGEFSSPELRDTTGTQQLPLSQQGLDLADCRRQLHRYANVLRGLVDRQIPLFEERVEITLMVGEQDGQDLIVERRWTTPRPYLVYRILGPIVTWPDDPSFELDDLDFTCKVDGQDTQVEVHLVQASDGGPLVVILFQPGLRAETEWVLRYRSPKLWSPLRSAGQDSLTWATATPARRHPATTSELTLKVVFPSSWTNPGLSEDGNLGEIHTDRLPAGQTQLTWRHDTPSAAEYRWVLHGSPPS